MPNGACTKARCLSLARAQVERCMHRPLGAGSICGPRLSYRDQMDAQRPVLKLAGTLPRAQNKFGRVLMGRLSDMEVSFMRLNAIECDYGEYLVLGRVLGACSPGLVLIDAKT